MKPSPLQLEWVTYPKLSYEASPTFPGEHSKGMPLECEAEVAYWRDGNHIAELVLRNESTTVSEQPYTFEVTVFARFKMDVELAREVYKGNGFPVIAAVNVCRILLSSARDLLSTVTARSPYGAAMIESVMLEPKDVVVRYQDDVASFKSEVFGIPPPIDEKKPETPAAKRPRKQVGPSQK